MSEEWRIKLLLPGWGWLVLLVGLLPISFLVARFSGKALLLVGGTIVAVVGMFLMLKRPYWFVVALVASLPVQVSVELGLGARVSIQLVFLLGLAFVLLLLAGQGNGRFWRTPFFLLWLLYLLVGTVAVLRGPVIQSLAQGGWALLRLIWSVPLMYVIAWMFLRDPMRVRQVLRWLACGAGIGGAIAVVQTVTQGRWLSGLGSNYRYLGLLQPLPEETVAGYSGAQLRKLYLSGAEIFRGHGTFIEHNGFGVFLSVTIFLTWGVWMTSRGRQRRWLMLALVAQLMGVVVTFSRSAWAAVFAGGIILLLWQFRQALRRPRTLVSLSALLMALSLFAGIALWRAPSLTERFTTIFSPGDVSEFNWRIHLWRYAIEEISAHPLLGVGTSMIDLDAAGISGTADQYTSHNLWVDIAYQRGLLALGLYLFFWLLFLIWGGQLLLRPVVGVERPLVLGFLVAGLMFLVSGIGTPNMTYYNLAILFWFLMGVMASLWVHARRVRVVG